MRVIVTGISGFLGRAVACELADRGVEVTGISRTTPKLPIDCEIGFIPLDLCQDWAVPIVLAEARPQVLVHLATSFVAGADCRRAERFDYQMWRNLAATATSVDRVVIASTELYRSDTQHLTPAQRVYVSSKRQIERMALEFCQQTGIPTLLYRFPHLAGATEQVQDKHDARILNRLLRSALGIDPDPVEIYVPGLTQLRYLNIQAAAETVANRVCSPVDGFAIHECGTEAVAINFVELVHLVGRVAGKPPKVDWRYDAPAQPELNSWRLSKAERMVRDTLAWFTMDPARTDVLADD